MPSSPLELLLLGCLQHLGRRWTFNNIIECVGISINVISNFFKNFIAFSTSEFYIHNAYVPVTNKDLEHNSSEYETADFTGAIGLVNAVNMVCDKISYNP